MKKIYSLILVLAVLCSCSSDDTTTGQEPDPIESQLSGTPGFLKYTKENHYGSITTIYYSYDGDKLSKIFYSGGSYSVYTYTGDLITLVERFKSDNTILFTEKYFYDEEERLIKHEEAFPDKPLRITELTHNEDGSTTVVFKIIQNGETQILWTCIQRYNDLGELIEIDYGNQKELITYDTANNPWSLIKGFDKISVNGISYSNLHNVINIRTIWYTNGIQDHFQDRPQERTYNDAGFPLTLKMDIEYELNTTSTYNYTYTYF